MLTVEERQPTAAQAPVEGEGPAAVSSPSATAGQGQAARPACSETAWKALILAGLGVVAWLWYRTLPQYVEAISDLKSNVWLGPLLRVAQALVVVNVAALAWRLVLAWRYRPQAACTDEQLPTCTVIVPAYNEGRQVLDTLRSIAASDYPPEKLTILAVDDGSADDTWVWLLRAARELRGRVRLVRQPVNRGKRLALYEGFRRSDSEVFVTIDSDSQIEPTTLRRLVSPMVRDRRVGAVAGNVRILNRQEGVLPRMLDVSFTYGFDFLRASQSMVNTVMCTPGALSGYRADLVMRVLPMWLGQRFCGRRATIGEDRAMTNLILREGYHCHFQRDAVVHTKVPTAYKPLCRMLLRWARSNVRETIVMSRFAFGRFRLTPATGARINLLLHWLTMTLGQALKAATLACVFWLPWVFGIHLVAGAAMVSTTSATVYFLRHRSGNALWAYPYGVFWVLGLSWIGLYALMTPQKTSWLTRRLPAADGPSAAPGPWTRPAGGRAA